jgi:hypothetical protein
MPPLFVITLRLTDLDGQVSPPDGRLSNDMFKLTFDSPGYRARTIRVLTLVLLEITNPTPATPLDAVAMTRYDTLTHFEKRVEGSLDIRNTYP